MRPTRSRPILLIRQACLPFLDSGKSFFACPSTLESIGDRRRMYREQLTPFKDGFGDAITGDQTIDFRITALLLLASPPAILGRIGAIVVNAIEGFLGWFLAHVREKRFERVEPSLANDD